MEIKERSPKLLTICRSTISKCPKLILSQEEGMGTPCFHQNHKFRSYPWASFVHFLYLCYICLLWPSTRFMEKSYRWFLFSDVWIWVICGQKLSIQYLTIQGSQIMAFLGQKLRMACWYIEFRELEWFLQYLGLGDGPHPFHPLLGDPLPL